jgi:hypothetical protein
VAIQSCATEETTKTARLKTPEGKVTREITFRDWRVTGAVGGIEPVEVVINDTGRIIFGRCGCSFFQEHLMNQGPCEHILAIFKASESQRTDASTSKEADDTNRPSRQPSRWEAGDGFGEEDNVDSDEDE